MENFRYFYRKFSGMTKNDITELLGGSKVLGKPKDLSDLAEEGLPKQALVVFMQKINLDERRLFTYLDVTKRTLDNYKPKERLRLYISDRLIHLAELYAKGKEIFSSVENFNEWLNRPSIDFLGEKPIDLINTRRGIDEILKTLGRIEHGILA
jgi:putative toxin-antitoxin system antitoxin component (TIGR02293 family)